MSTEPTTPAQPQAPAEPQMVTLLCVGGPRHGQEVAVAADARQWLDIASAQTYRRQWFTTARQHQLVGRPVEAWRRYVLVWDAIPVPESIDLLADWLTAQWVIAGGEQIPVSSIELAEPSDPPNGGIPQ